ncbi:hypothetical protein BpHYR1_030955 [Brachionus plicatilis]|uniref:Uncharacterized protein n=1 Tax=Brachionus plicatilis TaxID=10195 RepID=A0A3M7SVS6_BRAPC|nr:hypothetical protein BpHYR1_030955 [Brachionus plicatilis]
MIEKPLRNFLFKSVDNKSLILYKENKKGKLIRRSGFYGVTLKYKPTLVVENQIKYRYGKIQKPQFSYNTVLRNLKLKSIETIRRNQCFWYGLLKFLTNRINSTEALNYANNVLVES